MKRNLLATIAALLLLSSGITAQFNYGNIVVLQAGDGTGTLSATGNPIVLREFSTAGTPGFSVVVPSSGTTPMIIAGNANTEGGLSLTPDLKQLVFAGYAQGLPNALTLSSSTGSLVNRAVGVVDASGSFTRVATSGVFHSGSNIRSATSDGQNNYWSAGGNQGTNYFGTASPAVQGVQTTVANTRNIRVFNNGLYFSTGSGTQGIYQVGTGLPVTSGNTATLVMNTIGASTTAASPYEFYFNPSMTVAYVADDRSVANGGGIMKFIHNGSAWTYTYTLNTGTTSARGVIADFSQANPVVYATTSENNNNRLIAIEDIGASSTFTLLATSGSSTTVFRGLAFAPCAAPQILSAVSGGSVCSNSQLSLSVTTSGSAPSYTWAGAGTFNNANSASVLVSNPQTGNYTITVENACGTASSVVAATVEPAPAIAASASPSVVCSGGQVTLTASGANTYSWSNGVANGSAYTATSTAVYTVTGTAGNGCTGSETVAVTVNPLPVISVNSISVCAGDQGTLTASGAATYTWNTGSNSASIVVSPTTATSYTVEGSSAAGCSSQTVTSVGILSAPNISVSGATLCSGSSATLSASGTDTYTWSTGANTSTLAVSPVTNTTYTVSGHMNGCSAAATETVAVTVNAVPSLSVASTASLLCEGYSATITVSGANSYTWNNGSNTAAIAVSPTVNTSYTVSGTNGDGCSSTVVFTQSVSTCAGVIEQANGVQLNVFPNPSGGAISIEVPVNTYVTISNSLGQELLGTTAEEGGLKVEGLSSGIYFVRAGAAVKMIIVR